MTGAPDRKSLEGIALPPGCSLGVLEVHAGNAIVRDAAAVLTTAGHVPALLSGKYDSNDIDTARGTGFHVAPRGDSRALVYHLVDGGDGGSVSDHRDILRACRKSLREAGWECDGRIFRCVHAWRTSPLPSGVTAALSRGEGVDTSRVSVARAR